MGKFVDTAKKWISAWLHFIVQVYFIFSTSVISLFFCVQCTESPVYFMPALLVWRATSFGLFMRFRWFFSKHAKVIEFYCVSSVFIVFAVAAIVDSFRSIFVALVVASHLALIGYEAQVHNPDFWGHLTGTISNPRHSNTPHVHHYMSQVHEA
jgi:hypothetical protein